MTQCGRPQTMRHFLACSFSGALACALAGALAFAPAAPAAASEAVVQQVDPDKRSVAEAIAPVETGSPGIGLINDSIPAGLLNDFHRSIGTENGVTARQIGDRNRARIAVWGSRNAVSLRQVGSDLVSQLDVAGNRNRVLVDQEGNRLTSDVNVIGSNQLFVHVQRGQNIQGIPVTVNEGSDARFVFDIRRNDGTYGRVSFDAAGKRLQETPAPTGR